MRFLNLRLRDFRNIEFAELDVSAPRNFLLGSNGQGKSNLLEALGLVTALRSFRTQNNAALPRRGSTGYIGVYGLDHEHQGRTQLELRAGAEGRKVRVDGEKIGRLGDFIGRFPVVPLSAGGFDDFKRFALGAAPFCRLIAVGHRFRLLPFTAALSPRGRGAQPLVEAWRQCC